MSHIGRSSALERIIKEFEDAWRSGQRPVIEHCLPAGNEEGHSLLLELVHVELELRLRAGEEARVEEYLARFPELAGNDDQVLDLIASEYAIRREKERGLEAKMYQQRFPDLDRQLPARLQSVSVTISDSQPVAKREFPHIPGYEILEFLDEGGMGMVYKARQIGLERIVAVKMMLRRGSANKEELARFRTEAEAVARLQNPNIVQIHEIGESHTDESSPPAPYFCLEYCSGGSLKDHLNGMPLAAANAARLTATLARAMHAAHGAGIIHRDLKPGNILLQLSDSGLQNHKASAGPTPSPQDVAGRSAFTLQAAVPKIADFGLAKKLDETSDLTRSGFPLGTPSYMAPEQAAGRTQEMGPAVDIYALGAILYEFLTGRPPFRGPTWHDTIRQVIGHDPVPPARLNLKVPRDLETICLKCLRKEPGKRYGSSLELAEDLGRFLAHEPVQARPVSRGERMWRWCRRNPTVAGLLVAAATLMVLFGSLWIYTVSQSWQRASAIEVLLAEAAGSLGKAKLAGLDDSESLPRALGKLDEAKAIVESGPVSAYLTEQELDLRRQVEEESKGRRLISQLEEIKGQVLFQDGVAQPTYGEVFRDNLGIEAKQMPPAEAGELIRQKLRSPSDFWLVAALDAWLFVSRKGPGVEEWVAEVLEVADKDAWRSRARKAWLSRDRQELEKLTAEADVLDQPPVSLLTLGEALLGTSPETAAALLRRAQQQHPGNVWINFELAVALERCQPPQRREAVRFFTAAVALGHRNAVLLTGLGNCLKELGQIEEAIAAFRKAVLVNPEFSPALESLADTLRHKGQFREALEILRTLQRKSALARQVSVKVAELKRLVELEGKLTALLDGTYQPKDEELTGLFEICYREKYYHAAYKQLDSLVANNPKLATDLKAGYRSRAACAAALAACGQGRDAEKLDNEVRGALRHKALRLLEEEMALWQRQLSSGDRVALNNVQKTLARWEQNEDFAGVRDPADIAKLPTAQQRAWKEFWRKVDVLLAEAQLKSKRWLKPQ